MILTLEKFSQITKNENYKEWYDVFSRLMPEYEIDTHVRVACFLSQCAHESGDFKFTKENLNYRWESLRRVFPKYFPNDALAKQYARQPEKIANRVYANRMGNGPESSGDGWRYRGRGVIQLTGRNNYQAFANDNGMALSEVSDYLETFEGAAKSAFWYWDKNKLNRFADDVDLEGLTKAINGGYNGLQDRIDKYNDIIEILLQDYERKE